MAEALRGTKIRSFRFQRCVEDCRIDEKRREEFGERVKNLESAEKKSLKLEGENRKSSSLDPHHQHQIFSSNQEEEEEEEKNHFYGGLEAEGKPKPPRAPKKRSSSAISSGGSFEYGGEMVDLQREAATSSRMGMRGSGGEIVEVQGGHIVRSIGRKDRHSKVCTAKGPRDRRVRLSAHTAIQFYDVQDRLGYDRPSKAVDWLIKKAKTAIDELEELPAWKPSTLNSIALQQREQRLRQDGENNPDGTSSSLRSTMAGSGSNTLQNPQFLQMGGTPNDSTSSLLPRSLDSDSIADSIKSFFPMGATTSPEISSSAIQFQSYPPVGDLRLSLQCFKDPLSLNHQQAQHHNHQNEHPFFSGASPLPAFDGGSLPPHWLENSNSAHPLSEIGQFQRMVSWNASGAETGGGEQEGGGNGSFIFNIPSNPPPPPPPPLLQPLFGETQFFSQRGPLQSSYTPMFRAWIDPSSIPSTNHQIPLPFNQSPFSGLGFAAAGAFSGIRNPAQFQGEEEHDGISGKPSSASSNSRH